MRFPTISADKIVKGRQAKFDGLNHNLGAGDGELWDMQNLTSDYYPLLATRQKRKLLRTLTKANGITAHGGLAWVDGTKFYYNGVEKGTVTDGKKTFAAIGAFLCIFPDAKYYDVVAGEFGSLESKWSGASLTFTNGTLYGEAAEANCIQCTGVTWSSYFNAGDAVTITGCTTHPENNKTPIIREIDGDKLYFYEHVFTLNGDGGDEPYTESGTLKVERTVPEISYVCENENRLWASDGKRIFASKLGDPFNWNVYDGLDTDSWCWPTDEAGIIGGITGAVSFLGYPIFFKEDHIYKVYGSTPVNFEVNGGPDLGVASGSAKSIAIAGETLFYLSPAGFVAYAGGIPRPIGAAFGLERQKNAVGGSDGLKYYVSYQDAAGTWKLAVYDTQKGMWHIEDTTQAVGFCRLNSDTYMLDSTGKMHLIGTILSSGGTAEADFQWSAEFGDNTDDEPNKKGVSRLQIRLELDANATATVYLKFDSTGDWIQAGQAMPAGVKRSYVLPIIPRRCDHYRMKITGTGGCRIYSIAREYYTGSDLKSQTGRN